MKMLFQKLVWKRHKFVDKSSTISELEKYADIKFDNGAFARVNTGEMANTNSIYPYEVYVEEPGTNGFHIPRLTASQVNTILNELDQKTFE